MKKITLPHSPEEEKEEAMTEILVVDDDDMVRESVARSFKIRGYDVTTASSGTEAIDAIVARQLEGKPFNLVFTDWEMPGIRGDDLCRWIKSRRPNLPVIIASGHAGVIKLDCADVALLKPVSWKDIETALERLSIRAA
jgi:CheY-like chemotaxis protein